LLATLLQPGPPVVLVVEETGWGVVPPTAIGGLFRDRLGALHQQLMRHAGAAWLVLGGRALDLMQFSHQVPEA
jgi:adenosylcobinamide kinase/adenosylcobinamide-phosphate guanylyltransferase